MVYMVVTALGRATYHNWIHAEVRAEIPTLSVKNWAVPVGRQLINSPGPLWKKAEET